MLLKKNILTYSILSLIAFFLIINIRKINQPQIHNKAKANNTVTLTISAATSLQNALKAIQPKYTQLQPQVNLVYNFGSSGSLQQQIEQGAPVDIFISAAIEQMASLDVKNLLLPGSRRNLLSNKIVLIVPKNSNKINSFADLTTDALTKIALGIPETVPAGKYAQQVLTSLGIIDTVIPKAVYGKDVQQVLNYVATENVDAGIVYLSNAKFNDQVKIVATAPEASHSPVIYPIAILKATTNPQAARELVDYFFSPDAQNLFKQYGFIGVN